MATVWCLRRCENVQGVEMVLWPLASRLLFLTDSSRRGVSLDLGVVSCDFVFRLYIYYIQRANVPGWGPSLHAEVYLWPFG